MKEYWKQMVSIFQRFVKSKRTILLQIFLKNFLPTNATIKVLGSHAREVRRFDTFPKNETSLSKRKKARPANWVVISTSTPPNPFNQARTNK